MEVSWRVLYVKSKSERRVGLLLSKLGLETYIPTQKELRTWSDRKKLLEIVLFPNYVFVKTNGSTRSLVFESSHVSHYVRLEGCEALLSEKEINDIRLLCESGRKLLVEGKVLEKGEQVLIEKGCLAGLCGEVIEREKNKFLKVEILGLSCYIRSEIKVEDLSVL